MSLAPKPFPTRVTDLVVEDVLQRWPSSKLQRIDEIVPFHAFHLSDSVLHKTKLTIGGEGEEGSAATEHSVVLKSYNTEHSLSEKENLAKRHVRLLSEITGDDNGVNEYCFFQSIATFLNSHRDKTHLSTDIRFPILYFSIGDVDPPAWRADTLTETYKERYIETGKGTGHKAIIAMEDLGVSGYTFGKPADLSGIETSHLGLTYLASMHSIFPFSSRSNQSTTEPHQFDSELFCKWQKLCPHGSPQFTARVMQLANDNCCELFDADAVLSKLSAQESHAEEGINQLISFALQSLPKLFEVLSEKASPDQLRATVTQKLKDLLHKGPEIRQKTKELVHLCQLSREPSTAEQKDLLHRYCSFLHGDFHAGNIAFRKRAVDAAAGESQSPSQYDICPVDWQSYGLGDPVAELVYHIFGVVSASDVLNEFAARGVRIDETLLEFYHARRSAERQSTYPLSELKERYDLLARNATLLLIADAYRWLERARKEGDGVTPSKLRHDGFMSLEESDPTSTFLNAWMDSTAARALAYFICEPL